MNRIALFLMLFGMTAPAGAQSPTVEFASPTRNAHGFMMWRFSDTVTEYRYYDVDGNSIRIMTGPYSTTVATTIPLEAGEQSAAAAGMLAYADMSGDGVVDLVLTKSELTMSGGSFSFRVVNSVTGQTILRCEDPSYWCMFLQASDIDNDGRVELIVKRSGPPTAGSVPSQYVVFQTNGIPIGRPAPDSEVQRRDLMRPR
jgi:hypothetical protein